MVYFIEIHCDLTYELLDYLKLKKYKIKSVIFGYRNQTDLITFQK